jgi:farnesyl diphosphate synthase
MTLTEPDTVDFTARIPELVRRVEACMDEALPAANRPPGALHEAMRYACLTGGKRIRPLLVYATGECLHVDAARLDVPATAIEFIHAFSLVHDDLPAMDDDDLRRGQPTVHRKFDEATAILAADALQPLAFQVIAESALLSSGEVRDLVALIAAACGSLGMTGGQAIDLASEGCRLTGGQLAEMHRLKTGALISASVMSACCLADRLDENGTVPMRRFATDIGLAFQIRDDILDVTGETDVIGKPAGSDAAAGKATWPALFGMDESVRRCRELLESAMTALDLFGPAADPLRTLASLIVERSR